MPISIPIISSSGARSTKSVADPVIQTGTASPGLFFSMPNMSASPKKVFGNLFGPFPRSWDNYPPRDDYYATEYLDPAGEGNACLAQGGRLRNRPMPRPPRPSNFAYEDAAQWVLAAKAAGLDGFFCNIMGGGGNHLELYTNTLNAANAVAPGFYVIPMIDAYAVSSSSTPAATVASWIAQYAGKSSTYKTSSNVMLPAGFATESAPVSWWQAIVNALKTNHGITAKFIQCFVDYSNVAAYTSVQHTSGMWGPGAEPTVMSGYDPGVTSAHNRGEQALVPVWYQDVRPLANWCEALNTSCLRASWDKVIATNPEMVQMCTWSDFSEGSELCDTPARGQVATDISAYYIARYKTGSFPTILRDALYLSYRNHVPGAPVRGPQTQFMPKRTFGGGAATRYAVEALVFLTAPATVEITVAGSTSTFSAPAGMSSHIKTVTGPGAVSARVVRSGATSASLSSPVPIRPDTWVEDRQYFSFGSIRGTAGQFDPMFTSTGQIPVYP